MVNQGKIMARASTMAVLISAALSAHAGGWVATQTKSHVEAAHMGMMASASAQSHGVTSEAAPGMPVQVTVSLKLRNKSELDALTTAIMSGQSRQYLTPEQFKARYAPTVQQVDAVVRHLRAAGFSKIEVAPNRLLINAEGNATAVKTAFHTSLQRTVKEGRQVYFNKGDAMVPQELASTVLAVQGLQTVNLMHTMNIRAADAHTMASAGVNGHYAPEFQTIYNASGLPAANSATVAIVAQGDISQTLTDLNAFASANGYAAPNTNVVNVGTASADTSGLNEWNMDSQSVLAAAGGSLKQLIFYVSPTMGASNLTNAYNRAVTDNIAKTISVSIGGCETNHYNSGDMAAADQIFQQAVSQGQVFAFATGDKGYPECSSDNGQSYPATSPYVIAVGGTTLTTNGTAYVSEAAWSKGGGGPSLYETAPSWQKNSGVLGTATARGIPDIAFDADPASGSQVLLSGAYQKIGGTSLATPLFAGFWARVQANNGNALPYPGSLFYSGSASVNAMYRDVTSGYNGGYSATTGWDYATGFGSIDIARLNAAVQPATTPPPVSNPVELIVNGGFEQGTTGWSDPNGDIGNWSGETAYAGKNYAWMGGYNNATEKLSQTVTIPSNVSSAKFSFFLHIDTQESGSTAYDKLSLSLRNASGAVLATLGTFSNVNAASGYQQYSADLSAYRGQQVQIVFSATTDSTLPTNFVLDNVSLLVK